MKTIHKIKNLRNKKKISQEEMAEKLGIEQNTYSRIENGMAKLKHEHAVLIANIFDVPITELIDDDLLKINIQDNKVESGTHQFIQDIINTINVEQMRMIEYLKSLLNKKEDLITVQSEQITKLIKILEK
jgi:transcriptional regulator with XRE-family HTH domain